jgi:membrane-bound lytic murein transglycosylase B
MPESYRDLGHDYDVDGHGHSNTSSRWRDAVVYHRK